MEEKKGVMRARCSLYACRVCRTKTGWPHQPWCELAGLTGPDCGDCLYYGRNVCLHPTQRKGAAAWHERIHGSF